ncbi:hypothetical protein C8R45DRAFT_1071271 [Mycena sanguinolenta]|nr:hypothetical protein C8R45DRAFT_1071271 [Mycena sanguinolenta]
MSMDSNSFSTGGEKSQRCDSVRPICGPCSRAQRFEDCEYEDSGDSNVEKLERSVFQVQSRIMELENRSQTPSLMLRSPYTRGLTNVEPGSSRQSHPQPQGSNNPSIGVWTFPSLQRLAFSYPSLQTRLDAFAPYAHQVAFFLNPRRFRNSFLRIGGSEELPAALVSSLSSQENNFLSHALKTTTTILSSTHRLKILHGIQTEILLSQYFLHQGRLLEAQYHLSTAVSYVVLGDLANFRRTRASGSFKPTILIQDCIEEGEAVIAFWTVFSMDKILSSVLDFPSNFPSESENAVRVDTPWPLEMEHYERNQVPQIQPTHTVQRFVDGVEGDNHAVSCLAILAQSAILLAKAALMARQWRPNMTPAETNAFLQPFMKLNKRITNFRESLPPPNSLAACTAAAKPRMILAYTLAHTATIHLHRIFISVNPPCREACLTACMSIVWIVRAASLRNVAYVHPILGSLWSTTGQILNQEIVRLRAAPNTGAIIADLKSASDDIAASVAHFSKDCPFILVKPGPLNVGLLELYATPVGSNELSRAMATNKPRILIKVFGNGFGRNPQMSDSGASSKTLSTEHSNNGPTSVVPYELIDVILSHAIAEVIHETVDRAFQSQSISQALFSSRNSLGTLAGVSASFRVIVLKLVAVAFRIPLPCERVLIEAHRQFHSLLLFKGALLAGAVMNPPEAWSPLMKAYGYHLRARCSIPRLKAETSLQIALDLCKGTNEGLSWPLVGLLTSQLQEVTAAEIYP